MPPKKQKIPNNEEKAELGSNQNEDDNNREQKRSKNSGDIFKCVCGKTYGSLAAVHTHINNKHNKNDAEKKKYKAQIFNPKKSGQTATTSIRMKDINYPQVEAELMCHADITLKTIYDIYCQIEKNFKENDILIDVNDDLSDDSDIDIDDELMEEHPVQETERRRNINFRVKKLKEQYKIEEIDELGKEDPILENFKISKFRLNLLGELSKFFIIEFAAKVEFSLEMIHYLNQLGADQQDQKEIVENVLNKLWDRFPQIGAQLSSYYTEWNEIRFNYQQWKRRADEAVSAK